MDSKESHQMAHPTMKSGPSIHMWLRSWAQVMTYKWKSMAHPTMKSGPSIRMRHRWWTPVITFK
ncbi:hypothetical protein DPMN_079763 [Dreissena polymorpha]|uniref:Uncharacterized protein n=1 Tax=Dreissena polymorpha TaxID=45954 RepID=A0A9D4BRF9_DREPO|nr:hypothetical protein DPMN_079763 [Dreissena polymorpha]